MEQKTILLIEDNQDDADLTLRAILKTHISNHVTHVHDGAEALEYLLCQGLYAGRDINHQPALILLDLQLPKLGGLDLLKQIRAEKKISLLPVVVLTSSNEQSDILESYRLGANSYIRKPVDFSSFLDAVHHLGLYWLMVNQCPPVVYQ